MTAEGNSAGPPRHIIWDWNGTLLDDSRACVVALNRMLRRRKMREIDQQQYRDIFDFPVRSYYVRLGFDFETEDWDENAREFHAYYSEASDQSSLRPGVVELLQKLRDDGIPMSILSAAETGILENMLSEYGIVDFFTRIYGLADPYAHTKIERGRTLMADLQVPPERVLLVGDTTHDHEVARAIGCRCILLTGGHQSPHRLQQCGCPVVSRLSELLTMLDGTPEREEESPYTQHPAPKTKLR
jgi:phosphoglycolate phosphatase